MINLAVRLITLFFFLSVSFKGFCQERTLGTWKSWLSYKVSLSVCDAGDRVYCAAEKSVYSYEKATGVIQIFDKTNGLSDLTIKAANYDPSTKVLVIAYLNSNMDLIYNGTDVYNISDIKLKATTGALTINGISFYNGKAYISSDLGISEIDLDKKEISNTYIIGSSGGQVKVYATSIDGNYIYAATEEGVKRANIASSNLQDFSSWQLYTPAQNNLPTQKATFVTCFNNKVYAVIASSKCDTLYRLDGNTWNSLFADTLNYITSLNAVNNNLYFTVFNNNNTTAGRKGKIDASGSLTVQNVQGHVRPTAWFESDGFAWEADGWNGLYKVVQGNVEQILPDGPYTSAVFKIESKGNTLKIAPGGVDDSWGFAWNFDGFFSYENNKWKNRNQYTDGILQNYSDILSVVTVEERNKTYYGSFLSGIVEVDNGSGAITTYDKNSPGALLEGATGDAQRTKISAMTKDQYGNLWIGNAGATKPIKVIKADGTWKQFSTPYAFDLMKKMVIDQNDQLWAPLRGAAATGILVWSYNGTIDDPTDDVVRLLKGGAGNGGLPNDVVNCLAEDKEGNMWVGTNEGIAVYYCPGSVLTSNGCDADQIKVERDGYIGYLFGTESVRAIAVDAANRKWIGTTNGLWLISGDGKQELLKFTQDNSPLPANQITDIVVNDVTGEVFIGTIGGLVSYQGDAMGECTDCDGALVYPNPVKPDYNGPIAIKGLVDQAYVKITDISGTLVYQGKANGSQMIWDGKGYNGQRAKSGVYLVFSSTDLGKQRKVAKLLLLN